MKYNNLTLGTIEAVVNKLGGMEGVEKFLRDELVVKEVVKAVTSLLRQVATVVVNGAERFVARDAFGESNPDGINFFLWNNFQRKFLGKVEGGVPTATIAVHRLEKALLNRPIMAELGVDEKTKKGVMKLAQFYELIKAQAHGEEGSLLVNGYANIAYIEDEEGNLWTVVAGWGSVVRAWSVSAVSVENPDGWFAGRRVLSQV